jgi:glycosyltransferase involved in cell wall biosynthesis
MLSTFATAERLTKPPRILDVDDAIWLLRGGKPAVAVAHLCDIAICGNSFLADFFRRHVARVFVLPTPVNTERYRPVDGTQRASEVICWSGTSSGMQFLYQIEPALAVVLGRNADRRLRIISNTPPRFQKLRARQVEFIRWSEDVEVAAIQSAGIGIMPLPDSNWARGKCSYKLLTYMACGLPVVATPVGMNAEVLARGDAGLCPRAPAEWADALEDLLKSPARAAAMGAAGREVAVRDYSLAALASRLAGILQMAKAGTN